MSQDDQTRRAAEQALLKQVRAHLARFLQEGERMYVSFKLERPREKRHVRITSEIRTTRDHGPFIKETVLQNEDWERILALRWRPKNRAFLGALRDSGNRPISKFGDRKHPFPYERQPRINKVLREHGLPYMIKTVHLSQEEQERQKGQEGWEEWSPGLLQMCIVEQ